MRATGVSSVLRSRSSDARLAGLSGVGACSVGRVCQPDPETARSVYLRRLTSQR
jgi:hypothetical protein